MRDNTAGFAPPISVPDPNPVANHNRRTYFIPNFNQNPVMANTPAPVVTAPTPTGGSNPGMQVGGNQGSGAKGSHPTNPQLTMTDYLKNNVSGKAMWEILKKLPDAYQAAMYNALVGTGGNYDPTSGFKSQNDLWGTMLHEKFGGNHDDLNNWSNYWNHTNANARPTFDASTGKFHSLDVGYDLNKAQYKQHLNDFWDHEGTGQSVWKSMSDFGIDWSPAGMEKIGQAPWYQPSNNAIIGGAPFGQAPQPGVTPSLAPTPYPPSEKLNPNVVKGPGVTVPNAPAMNQPVTPVAPSITTPANPAGKPSSKGYQVPGLQQRGWSQFQ